MIVLDASAALELLLRSNCTAYDAAYIVLAEALNAVLITCDSRLADVPGSRAAVEVITP